MSDREPPRRPPSRVPSRRPEPGQEDPYDYERIFRDAEEPDPPLMEQLPMAQIKRYGAIAFAVIAVLFVITFLRHQLDPAGKPRGEVILTVPKGATTTSIAELLDKRKVIPSATAFKLWVRKEGDKSFQAGEYTFHRNSSVAGALIVLRKGPKVVVDRLVIPEGFRIEQIADRVGGLPGRSAEKFRQLATSGLVRSEYSPPNSNSLEGLLFPDTYLLSEKDNEERLLRRMVSQFEVQARVLSIEQGSAATGRTPYETIVIASMIEAEAKVPQDRGKISQVISNRLFKGMPLQIDATVLYAIGNKTNSLSSEDLKRKSPYNTYVNTGLPVGPIGNPGAASIRAALTPTPGPWLYYVVTERSGAHSFATTLQEHQRNVALGRSRGVV